MHYDTFYNIENIRNLYTQLLEYKSVGEHVDSQVETSSRILSYSRVENMTSLVRKPAPKWKATAVVQGRIIETNSEVYEGKYYVLMFYPYDFSFVCPTEILELNDAMAQFKKIDCEVLACSTDSYFSHHNWSQKPREMGGLGTPNIPLLADFNKKMSRDFGVLDEEEGISLRGLFIISDKGIVRHASVNDVEVGRCVNEIHRLVVGFQYTDQHGEVCPASWEPGRKAIKPVLK
ncbi:peroxiredoxin 2-like [Dysidea avara]|uniref:peroxiredoxin 2-like n=1 Tax=Dysidea avara TaxID=196820 RepID=UPI0033306885